MEKILDFESRGEGLLLKKEEGGEEGSDSV
jgi:hypothetical protein